MSTLLRPLEVVVLKSHEDDEGWHFVCHCTNDDRSACGLDVSDADWREDDDEAVCPLCELAWPDGAPTCPWGCRCEECGP